MKDNFFEKHKKKSLAALLLLFLKGRGKYFAVLLLALFASAPLVVTSDAFKAFTNHPAVAAVLRTFGLGAPEYSDKDMIAQAAHNSAGKKSSYWQKYFSKVNAPLPSGKFSSMKFLNGDISDIGPAEIKDKTKNKYGMKGVANEANKNETGATEDGVDLSRMVAMARGGGEAGDEENGDESAEGKDSAYRAMELGSNSALAPFMGSKTIMSKGGAENKNSALASKASREVGERVPRSGNPRKMASAGRVSGFSWRKMGRTKRANAFAAAHRGDKKAKTQMNEAYAYATLLTGDTDITPEVDDSIAGGIFDGNEVSGDVLDTGEPIAVPSGSYAGNLSSISSGMGAIDQCMRGYSEAEQKSKDILDESKEIMDSMDFDDPPGCSWWPSATKKRRRWNKKVSTLKSNCYAAEKVMTDAAKANCAGVNVNISEVNTGDAGSCEKFNDYKIECSFWDGLLATFGWAFIALACGLVLFGILMATTDMRKFVNGVFNDWSGIDFGDGSDLPGNSSSETEDDGK